MIRPLHHRFSLDTHADIAPGGRLPAAGGTSREFRLRACDAPPRAACPKGRRPEKPDADQGFATARPIESLPNQYSSAATERSNRVTAYGAPIKPARFVGRRREQWAKRVAPDGLLHSPHAGQFAVISGALRVVPDLSECAVRGTPAAPLDSLQAARPSLPLVETVEKPASQH